MKRRTIVFTDDNGDRYATPEFNGDRSEFIRFLGNSQACDADWPDIIAEFSGVKTLADFKAANKRAQLHYRSFVNNTELERELLPIVKIADADITADKLESGNMILLSQLTQEEQRYDQ